MILSDKFFSITESREDEGSFAFKVKLNAEHAIYKAHFPGHPITPGVCIIQMATELLERHEQCKLQLLEAVDIKFRRPLTPDMEPWLIFRKTTIADGRLSTSASLEVEGAQYARLTMVYSIVES